MCKNFLMSLEEYEICTCFSLCYKNPVIYARAVYINEINRPLRVAVKCEVLYSYLIIIYFIIITDSIERLMENISVA